MGVKKKHKTFRVWVAKQTHECYDVLANSKGEAERKYQDGKRVSYEEREARIFLTEELDPE